MNLGGCGRTPKESGTETAREGRKPPWTTTVGRILKPPGAASAQDASSTPWDKSDSYRTTLLI